MTDSGKDGTTALGALCCAFRFLTVLPLPWHADRDGTLFPRSVLFFPLVGITIGGMGVLLCQIAASLLPVSVVACIAVTYLSAISGFLHLDGLADSGDGLLSHRSREASLSIMKDSRIGAMGVVVLVLVLLGKFAAFSTMTPVQLLSAIFLVPLAGRVAIVFSMACFPYARPEGGLGGLFYSAAMRKVSLVAAFLLVLCSWGIGNGRLACAILILVVVVVYGFGRFCVRRIGGVTGDTLGAVCELAEVATAIIICGAID